MAAETLFIFLEGNDDERFFKHIMIPKFNRRVKFIKYAQLKKKVVISYLKTIQKSDDDFIFVADIDEMPNVTAKVKWVREKFEQIRDQKVIDLPRKNISIVIMEIESWYIAGMTDSFALANHIEPIRNSEWINKEIFNNLFHGKFRSRIDFMQELLKYYSYETALVKNKSLDYFDNIFINEDVK